MSSIFSISSVTNAGIAAMQEALDHGYTMVFTAMKTGNGVYTTGEDVTGRTALKSLKNTYTIGSIEEDTDGATVSAVFTNYDGVNILVAEDYKINEIGLFCTVNSVEYLYALAAVPNDDGMEMPAYDVDAENLTQFIQEWYVANSNHANIAVNPVGAYIPVTDIVDNLTSTSTTKPLSAKQGKVLNDAKQPKTLSSPITIGGTSQTTVEGALGGLNTVKAERADITSISCTGSINATGETITNGSRFYLNGALCRATADIANGATFTLNTNFKVITVDEELTELNSNLTVLNGRIKFEQIDADISTSGIANLRTDGKPIIYVTTSSPGWYYSLGRSADTIWVKVFNYDGNPITNRTNITFYYYYLD